MIRKTWVPILMLVTASWIGPTFAQTGGTDSPFMAGMGARAMGLGGSGVAFPDDPYAFLWNPAGMVVVQDVGIGFTMVTLFEETQYNGIGYIHPTLSAGTFGIGISRIGTGGIPESDLINGVPVDLGEFSYWWGKLSLAYAFSPIRGFSLGLNFEANRQVMGYNSTNGFGLDAGIHYGFPSHWGILSNSYLGLCMVNVVSPRLKLGGVSETLPNTFRAGFAKFWKLRDQKDRLLLLADFQKTEKIPAVPRFGIEYAFGNLVYLRLGVDSTFAFGGGIRYKMFQIDYATCRWGDAEVSPTSHQFTLSFHFGKTLAAQRSMIEEAKKEEIQRRVAERMESDRQKRIEDGIKAGKEYMANADFFNARLEFARVLQDDRENAEVRNLLNQISTRESELQKNREESLVSQGRETERVQRDNAFIEARFNEGLQAFEKLDFRKAIERWSQALDRDKENQQIRNYIDRARTELENEVNRLLANADRLLRQGNLSEANKILNQAKDQSQDIPALNEKVMREIQRWDREVDFLTNYQAGVQRYGRGEYDEAARFLQKALEYNPAHERTRELLKNSLARSKGRKTEMEGEIKRLWEKGLSSYSEGRFEEAILTWEEALKLDPHNLTILNAIEGAKGKLETYKKKE